MQIVVKLTSKKDSLTPLLLAAGKGHFQVCTFTWQIWKKRILETKEGKHHFMLMQKEVNWAFVNLKSMDNNIPSEVLDNTFSYCCWVGPFANSKNENIEVKNTTTMKGWTPFHLATFNGHFDVY